MNTNNSLNKEETLPLMILEFDDNFEDMDMDFDFKEDLVLEIDF